MQPRCGKYVEDGEDMEREVAELSSWAVFSLEYEAAIVAFSSYISLFSTATAVRLLP